MPRPSPLAALAGLLTVALVVVGVVTVAKFRVFADVDERAHYDYVQEVAEERRLPNLERDRVSWEAEAIAAGTWPRRSDADPATLPFGGISYEAFQPPLYYLVAAPVFAVPGDHRDKLFVLRGLGLLLLLGAVALAARLAREVFGDRWLLPFCLVLAVLLWPGVVARSVTVSNAALELPLALAYLLAVWRATTTGSRRALVAAGALLGACLLTKLTLAYLAPLLLVPLVPALRRRDLAAAAVACVLPALILAPWVASNLDRYGTITADEQSRALQEPVVNPIRAQYGLDEVRSELPKLLKVALPQEWWSDYFGKRGVAFTLLPVALLLAAALVLVRPPPRHEWPRLSILAAPLVLGVALIVWTLLGANWAIFLPRYLHPALAGFALFAAYALRRATRSDVPLLALTLAVAAVTCFSWVWVAGAHYFPNTGAKLGIRAR